MSRINLSSGAGYIGAFYDATNNHVYPYTADMRRLHDHYGGRMYYVSRSGISCAGWIPARPDVMPVHTYRVDGTHPEKLRMDTPVFIGRIRLVVPSDYRAQTIASETAPAIGWIGWGQFWLGWAGDLRSMVRTMIHGCVSKEWERRDMEWSCYGKDGIAVSSRAEIVALKNLDKSMLSLGEWTVRRSLSGSFDDDGVAPEFFHRLGLRLTSVGLFKVRGGVALDHLPAADVSLAEVRQRATLTVKWTNDTTYVGKNGLVYYIYWLDVVDNAIVGAGSHNLTDLEAFDLLSGADASEVLAKHRDVTRPVTPPLPLRTSE